MLKIFSTKKQATKQTPTLTQKDRESFEEVIFFRSITQPYVVKTHRRLFCLVFNLMFNHKIVYFIVGFLNKRWKFLRTIYVGYSVEERYLESYAFPSLSYIQTYKWTPFLAGFLIQDGKLGLKFFISSNEDDFYQADNKENLIQFASKVEIILSIIP